MSGARPRRLAGRAVRAALVLARLLPARWLEGALVRLAIAHAERRPAAEALRFLFRLDHALYAVQGRKAVEYGGGVHTKHRHTGYHDFFVRRIQADERVLDVGCGHGALARDIATRCGARVVGLDLDAGRVAQARRLHAHPRVEYRCGDALALADAPEVDVVVLSNVLEHLPERARFLAHLDKTLAPERLLVRVPLFERDWRVPLKRELGLEWRLDPTHETEYTRESFAAEVAEAGLAIAHLEVRWGEIWSELRPAGGDPRG